LKKSLLIALALLVLPFSLLVSSGTANAAVETEKTLGAKLVTDAQLAAGLKAAGVPVAIAKTYEVPGIKDPDLISAARRWDAKDGSILFTSLLAYKDGHEFSAQDLKDVFGGDYAKNFATSFFDKDSVNLLGVLDPIVDDRDVGHAYEATFEGKPMQIISVTFVRGNMVGLVLYATADNQGTEVGALFGLQTTNLPD
jgi:hypothetical protein